MLKFQYALIALILAFLSFAMILIGMLILDIYCGLSASTCDQNAKMTVYVAVTMTVAAIVAAALVEGAFYRLQSRQSSEQHQEQMRYIERLEDKIDKILKPVIID